MFTKSSFLLCACAGKRLSHTGHFAITLSHVPRSGYVLQYISLL